MRLGASSTPFDSHKRAMTHLSNQRLTTNKKSNKNTATNTNTKKIQNDFNTFCFTDELHWVICLDEDSLIRDWNGSAKRSRAPQIIRVLVIMMKRSRVPQIIIRMLILMIDHHLVSDHHYHVSSCKGIFSRFFPLPWPMAKIWKVWQPEEDGGLLWRH